MKDSKKFVKYKDRCKSYHAGSSTCTGCDSDYWLDDEPVKKDDLNFIFTDLRELVGKLDNIYLRSFELSKRQCTIITDALQIYIETSKDQMTQEDIVTLVEELEGMLSEE